jgi:hypothetical protein
VTSAKSGDGVHDHTIHFNYAFPESSQQFFLNHATLFATLTIAKEAIGPDTQGLRALKQVGDITTYNDIEHMLASTSIALLDISMASAVAVYLPKVQKQLSEILYISKRMTSQEVPLRLAHIVDKMSSNLIDENKYDMFSTDYKLTVIKGLRLR